MTLKRALILVIAFLSLSSFLSASEPTIREIMRSYLASQGGQDQLDQVQSIRVEGELIQGGERFRLLQIKKRPNLIRLSVSKGKQGILMGYNGEVAWLKSKSAEQSTLMNPEAAARFITNAELFSQLYTLRDELARIKLLGEVIVEGEPCYELQLRTRNNDELICFLGKNDFLERKVSQLTQSKNGITRTEIYFSDFRKVPPLTLPFQIRTFSEGTLTNEIIIQSVDLNVGVFNTCFAPPGGLDESIDDKNEETSGRIKSSDFPEEAKPEGLIVEPQIRPKVRED